MKPTATEYRTLLVEKYPPETEREQIYASCMVTMADTIEFLENKFSAAAIVIKMLAERSGLAGTGEAGGASAAGAPVQGPPAHSAAGNPPPPGAGAPVAPTVDGEEFEDMPPLRASVSKVEGYIPPPPPKVTPGVTVTVPPVPTGEANGSMKAAQS